MATIRDVARMAGVSIATVSHVMNYDEKYRTTEDTRRKVWKAAAELNYMLPTRTNKARSARAQSGKVIKVGIVKNSTPEHFSDPFYAAAEQGIIGCLNEHGCTCQTLLQKELEAADSRELVSSFAGIIVSNPFGIDDMNRLKSLIPAIVMINDSILQRDCDLITYNHLMAVTMAVEHLVSRGHRQIAYIGGGLSPTRNMNEIDPRVTFFKQAAEIRGFQVKPEWMIDTWWSKTICREKTNALLDSGDYPTAILTGSDHMAAVVLNVLYERRIRVPDQVAIASITDLEFARYTTPPLTSVYVPSMEMGKCAAEVLLKRIQGDTSMPKQYVFPVSLSVRGTT